MKKIIAIAMALVMVMGIAVSASALEWNAAPQNASAGPFKIEVIKLTANSDVIGGKYYTVVEDAAAYGMSTIYYAIKLVVPSAADAKAYYPGSNFFVNDNVKVTITYTNISGKTKDTIYVPLQGYSQTLWFNGTGFDAAWSDKLVANCGCNDRHIMASSVTDTALAGVKACVGVNGDISDILIGGCYKVAEKKYYGVRPCQRCNATNLSGYLFTTDCGQNSVFFATNSAGKVTGVYVYENAGNVFMATEGNMVMPSKTLYRWGLTGNFYNLRCNLGVCDQRPAFGRVAIGNGTIVTSGANLTLAEPLAGTRDYNTAITAEMWNQWVGSSGLPEAVGATSDALFIKDSTDRYVLATPANWNSDRYSSSNGELFFKGTVDRVAPSLATTVAITDTGLLRLYGASYREYDTVDFVYGNVYFALPGAVEEQLYAVQAEKVVECDTPDLAFWNSVNFLFGLLGITYADVAAGNVYMTEDNLLTNFGFSTNVCAEKTWNAYTAAITVATVAEVPATGSMSYVGFAMIVLAIAAAVVTKKVRA